MKTDTIQLADPEDVAASREWAARRAAAALALQRAQSRRAVLVQTLGQDPAAAALDAITKAATAVAEATDAVNKARDAQTEADRAARRFEANEVATAQQEFDEATRAVSAKLAELLSEASTSTALTATVDGLDLRARYHSATATQPPLWDVATIPFRAHPSDVPVDPQLDFPAPDQPDYPFAARGPPAPGRPRRRGRRPGDGRRGTPARQRQPHPVGRRPGHRRDRFRPRRPGRHYYSHAGGGPDAAAARARRPRAAGRLDRGHGKPCRRQRPAADRMGQHRPADPRHVLLVARRLDPATGEAGPPLQLTADVLGLDPLSWLRVAADRGELSARVARVARARWTATLGPDAAVGGVVVHDPDPHDPAELTLGDLLVAADAARTVLATARALAPSDLAPLDGSSPAPDDAAEKQALAHVKAAEAHIDAVLAQLAEAAAADASAETVLNALFAAAAAGIAEATPSLDVEVPSLKTLQAQAAIASARLQARTADGPFSTGAGDRRQPWPPPRLA